MSAASEQNTLREMGQNVADAQRRRARPPEGIGSAGEGGDYEFATQTADASPLAENIPLSVDAVGQISRDTQATPAPVSAGTNSAGEGGQSGNDAQSSFASPLAEDIAAIRAAHRERVFWMEQRKRADLALGSYLRTALGWSLAKPLAERNYIKTQASDIMAAGEKHVKAMRKAVSAAAKGKVPTALPDMPEDLRLFAHIVVPQIEMRGKTDELEAVATKTMATLAKQLPVIGWASRVRGFGPLGLAIIVGEAGDLGNYANPGKLWKRMGVAVIDGKRQGGLLKTAAKTEWEAHGYNRVRRSRLYTIGSAMVMSGEAKAETNEVSYRLVYLDRKAYEAARAEADGLTVVPAAKIPKGKHDQFRSLGHIDNRARRYVEKRLLRDLWRAWRGAREIEE